MSSISGAGQGLYQFIQNLSANSQSLSITGAATADPAAAAAATGQPIEATGHHHRHDGDGGFQKIEQAVTSALQQASANGSSSDPNTAIENAIAQVFGNNNAAPTGAAATTSTIPGTPAAVPDGDPNAAGQTDNDSAARQAFFSTLQSYGVTPEQFHQDLVAAFQNAQGGQADPSAAFQSFPPGTAVDTAG